jgi:drug/metabolite transporter (DMT)-like permease
MWSWLSVLAVATGQIPPFQLAAMTFVVGACIGPLLVWMRTGRWPRLPRVPLAAWLVGVGGLFGYHALYFIALRLAPPAEAGLLNYFWPLLIVLFSALLPGERLKAHHLVGVGLGLVGTVLLFAGQGGANFSVAFVPGFAAALAAAFVWAGYSVLSRRLKAVPTDAVAGFCLATAILAALAHVVIEKTVWPAGAGQWLAVLALGVAPVGLAFYAWDVGMKHGDIRVLGAAAYATPVLSTALLVVAGFAAPSLSLAAAALLIAGGGLVAAKDMLTKQS